MSMIFRLPSFSETWWQLRSAMTDAAKAERDVSLCIDTNGRGEPMISVKVGEGVWTPCFTVTAVKWTAADLREIAEHLDTAERRRAD